MLVLIKGAGDLASGVAVRLFRAKWSVAMTDLAQPTAIRRTVAFSSAVTQGEFSVEGIKARFSPTAKCALEIISNGEIPVLADENVQCLAFLKPQVVVDAILAKRNTGTKISDAPIVIALGPGFTAGVDCHAVVETKRGHDLGRVFYEGSAAENTGIPGDVGGYTAERIIRAPCDGVFLPIAKIGDRVSAGDLVARVGECPVFAEISGVIRGILPHGCPVHKGMKSGDVDPRCDVRHCYTVSDKARGIGGGVLEAVLALQHKAAFSHND